MNRTGHIDQAVLENFTIFLLGAVLRTNTTCGVAITHTESVTLRDELRQKLVDADGGIDVLELQELLESFTLKGKTYILQL